MMGVLESINVGIAGAVGRGGSFSEAFEANGARILAVCDIDQERLASCASSLGANEIYTDYAEMLDKSDLDAVVIGTPMHLHVPQSLLALEKDIHVLCEVPAGVSIEECRALVQACSRSKAIYMMAENYTYIKSNMIIKEMVHQGLFGQVYYAEGEYLHELKQLNEDTPWRRQWQTGIEGITYGTHSLGPILQWMPGDRVSRVCCEGSGKHYLDPSGLPYCQDTSVMMCKTDKGALIKIRVDMLSDRPHAMTNYQLQGTDGAYESQRGGPGERSKIWLRKLSRDVRWLDMDTVMCMDDVSRQYVPEYWNNPPLEALRAGHGGGDYFEVRDFIRSIRGEIVCPIGIHEAMDMTLPHLVSQQSAMQGGAWLSVPDSRNWIKEQPATQIRMVWPASEGIAIPTITLPSGYELRTYRDEDKANYIALLKKAGFDGWDHDRLQGLLRKTLPEGLFLIEHVSSGELVATSVATHNPIDGMPYGGELGWVAGAPEHAGKGLGYAVCAAVIRRFLQAGYRNIYLYTDDFRLPALKTYLKLGFRPWMYCDGMEQRWNAIFKILKWN
jgi:predicted dehydrogenase/GNAT superfamily N-acetyltransferase